MKIAFISDVIYPFNIGGSEIRTDEIAKRLVKRGHEVHIYGAKWWEGKDIISKDGIYLHGLHKYGKLYEERTNKRRALDPIFLSIKLFKELKNQKYDIIDCLHFVFFNCYVSKAISILKKTPLVLTWQQHFGDYLISYFGNRSGNVVKLLEKHTLKFTKFNIASSETVKKDLGKAGMPLENIEVIFNGVDLEVVKNLKSYKKTYDLIFVGRLTYQKNIALLLETIQILKKSFPKIKLLIIGGGNELESLKKLSKSFEIENNVKFFGEVKDQKEVFKYMKKSKIFVLPSRFEGFPLVGVEANACGLPIVIADGKWNRTRDFITNNGFIAKNNPTDFAKKIEILLRNNKKRDKMGRNGRKKVKNLDWDVITEKTENYYLKITRKK